MSVHNKDSLVHLRREVLVRIIRGYLSDDFEKNIDKLPFKMRPKNSEVPYRCCVHKERAILRKRTIASLGLAIEEDDEYTPLYEHAKNAASRVAIEKNVLTVIDTACKGCVPNRVVITDICQGCVTRPCVGSCSFGAINFVNGRSVIDYSKCKSCMRCVQACPYKAIAKLCVPCEDACPVSAIKKTDDGYAKIDFAKCISCGRCISACPFGAVQEKSQLIDILKAIKSQKKVVAMLAPSVVGQLPCTINQIADGLKKAGFSRVVEVAFGADITAMNEAKEFGEKVGAGEGFMTTSCCKAYAEMVKKHLPELGSYVSHTGTPLHYTAKNEKSRDVEIITVFIGPCVAKRIEGLDDETVDYVMTFEEMGALFVALRIELAKCEQVGFAEKASREGRAFGISRGVAAAVIAASGDSADIKPVYINGLDRDAIKKLKGYVKDKKCPDGNLIEVMACPGGCMGGPCVTNSQKAVLKEIRSYSEEGELIAKVNPNKQ